MQRKWGYRRGNMQVHAVGVIWMYTCSRCGAECVHYVVIRNVSGGNVSGGIVTITYSGCIGKGYSGGYKRGEAQCAVMVS